MKLNIHNIQCVFHTPEDEAAALQGLAIVKSEKRGSLNTLTVRGKIEEIMAGINLHNPVFAENISLTLEEIFISETEVAGYDIKNLIF